MGNIMDMKMKLQEYGYDLVGCLMILLMMLLIMNYVY